jgi:hypothetical protein
MFESSIAYLLSMEWGREIVSPPTSSFSVKSDKGPDVTFFVVQGQLKHTDVFFVPFSTKKEFVVLFIWGKEGDNCVTIPTAKIQDELPTGVLSAKKISESLIHKIRIDASSDFLPSGNDFVFER